MRQCPIKIGGRQVITSIVTEKKLVERREIYKRFKDKLVPNKKSSHEVLDYLIDKYILDELMDKRYLSLVSNAVLSNEFFKQKLLPMQVPDPVFFKLRNDGAEKLIYELQEDCWGKNPVLIGIDLITGFVHVEGSCLLSDEIYAFQGIDEFDLKNYVRVAEYIACIKKFNREYYDLLL